MFVFRIIGIPCMAFVTNEISESSFLRFSFFPNIRKYFTNKTSSAEKFLVRKIYEDF